MSDILLSKWIKWTNDLNVNIKTLDEDHKKLIDYINELHVAMAMGKAVEVWNPFLLKLVDYTKNHFAKEEKLFETYNYPDTIAHKAEHASFINKITALQSETQINKKGLSVELMTFLKDWLRKHIMGRDQMYSEFLNKKGLN